MLAVTIVLSLCGTRRHAIDADLFDSIVEAGSAS
jgi:hypothetical protein